MHGALRMTFLPDYLTYTKILCQTSENVPMTTQMHEWVVPLTDAVVAVFLLALGGNLGSFLNVVVHRLPRGASVVGGGSRCPECGSPIRWHDNIPVLGWLLLRGRCRDCMTPISPRYPLVEACAAIVVGLVASVELLGGGANLPGDRFTGLGVGSDVLLTRTDWQLVAVCCLHCATLMTLLVWGLLDHDGQTIPRLWVMGSVLFAAIAGAAVPLRTGANPGLHGLVDAVLGLAVGAALGMLAGRRALLAGMMLIGAVIGLRGVLTVGLLFAVAAGLRRLLCGRDGREASGGEAATPAGNWAALDLFAAAVVHQLIWRWADGWIAGMPLLGFDPAEWLVRNAGLSAVIQVVGGMLAAGIPLYTP